MSTKSSVATDMAWNWVIQSLAKFKQVDSSTSLGLVKKAPAISDDMGKDAREMVALRVLEDLFNNKSDATVDVDSATNAKVSFDLSENCEDVLHRILGEASEPMTESEKQNWNVRPFILHKRASLPKSPLQNFKEALEDNHPLPTALKEMSSLGGERETEVTITNVDISMNDQTTVVEDDLTPPNPADENEKLQEDLLRKSDHVENFVEHEVSDHAETSMEHEVSIETPVEDLEEHTLMEHVQQTNGDTNYRPEQPRDDDDNVHEDAYREGRDKRVQINGKLQEESPLKKSDHVESSEHTVSDHVENSVEHEVSIESHVKGLEENTLMDHVEKINDDTDDRQEQPRGDDNNVHQGAYGKGRDKRVQMNGESQESLLQKSDHVENSIEHEVSIEMSVKGLEKNTLMDHVEQANDDTDDRQEQPRGNGDNVHQDAYRKRQDKRVQIDIQPNDGNQVQTCSDREGSEDERTDIAARKEAFFSSQGTLSQDFMATIDCNELCICMKCNKGVELLVCCSDACPFRVHESCLGFAAAFDDNGNFFCPFCAYSHAISKYLEGKKKASLARKQLQAFLSSGVKRRPNISSKKDACLDKNEPQQRAPDENIDINNNRGKKSCAPEASTSSRYHMRRQPTPKPTLQGNENGTLVPSVSGHSKRRRKSDPQYASPSLTLARRKNLQWTKIEEDTLKEAMQKFATDNNKKTPWKDILDFGRDVFDKRRTTIDLKDKWRNICKEKPVTKKQKL